MRLLQRLMLPDPDLPHAAEVFVRLSDGAALVRGGPEAGPEAGPEGAIALPRAGAAVRGDTYANLFNLGTWAAHGPVTGLTLRLGGTGPVALHLMQTLPDGTGRTLLRADLSLTPDGVALPVAPAGPGGLIHWQLTATGPAQLTRADILADAVADTAPPRLAIVITTFRREAAVTATAARIAAFLGAGHLPGAHLFVIDNGQSVSLPADPHVTLIANRNLGGAGGFARGLAAARTAGRFSHVLFMDDDAAFQMENLTRTCAFLRHATDPSTALAGAMVSAVRPWELWENGAIFDEVCLSQFKETDLRDAAAVTAMELATPAPKPRGFYGGWWYFAFPLAAVTHDPFPFFVRGDDVSFALANRLRIATLNGVMSLQDDFAAKESPQTLYLDMRYHLHTHIVQDGLRLGPLGTIRVAMRLILRGLVRMHYDSVAAQLTAWEDMLQGPRLFTDTIDMAAKRAQIAAGVRNELWGPLPAPLPPAAPPARPGRLRLALMKASLNGHLLPGFGLRRRAVTVPLRDRGRLWAVLGATRAVFVDADADAGAGRAYTVTHDKRRAARLMARAAWIALRWIHAWPRLSRAYRVAYGPMTRPAFWAAAFAPFPADG